MRIAGVDPGTVHTGVGILEVSGSAPKLVFSGTIHARERVHISIRLEQIHAELKAVFGEWKPDVLALEDVFFGKNFRVAVRLGEARSAAMIAARALQIPVVEYPPAQVKQSVCGNGNASKEQVQYMVRHLLHIRTPLNVDSADAVAVALCHLNHQKCVTTRKGSGRVQLSGRFVG